MPCRGSLPATRRLAAANAVFKWVNAQGGVNGRQIKYIRLDDCYDLAAYGLGCTAGASVTTLSQNQVLVAQDHVFATVGSLVQPLKKAWRAT